MDIESTHEGVPDATTRAGDDRHEGQAHTAGLGVLAALACVPLPLLSLLTLVLPLPGLAERAIASFAPLVTSQEEAHTGQRVAVKPLEIRKTSSERAEEASMRSAESGGAPAPRVRTVDRRGTQSSTRETSRSPRSDGRASRPHKPPPPAEPPPPVADPDRPETPGRPEEQEPPKKGPAPGPKPAPPPSSPPAPAPLDPPGQPKEPPTGGEDRPGKPEDPGKGTPPADPGKPDDPGPPKGEPAPPGGGPPGGGNGPGGKERP